MKRFLSVLTLCLALSTSVGVNNSQAGLAFILGAGATEGFDEIGWTTIGNIGTGAAIVGGLGLIVVAASNGGSGGSSHCESSRVVPVYNRYGQIIGHRTVCDRTTYTPGTPAGPMSKGAKIAMWIAGGLLLLGQDSENQMVETLAQQFPFIDNRESLSNMAHLIAATAGQAALARGDKAFAVSLSESDVREALESSILTDAEIAQVVSELR